VLATKVPLKLLLVYRDVGAIYHAVGAVYRAVGAIYRAAAIECAGETMPIQPVPSLYFQSKF
ncbi:MAG: hypothetical protein ABIO36_08435, partial [Pyrinomonadaceae bacterium]